MKKRMSDKQKFEQLEAFVQLSLTILWDTFGSVENVAFKTGLSKATIYRLFSGQYTLKIQWRTVQAVADAAGFTFTLSDTKAEMGLKVA